MNNNNPINPKLAKKTTEVKPYTTKRWLFYMLIPTLIMLGLTVLVLKGSMYTKEESIIGYNEVGNIDYKVFLKENEEFLFTSTLTVGDKVTTNTVIAATIFFICFIYFRTLK